MVTDKFRPSDVKHPEPKQVELLEKGQDVLKAEKKELKFTAHTIRSGESLTDICHQYGIPLKALYAVNQHALDPKIIQKPDSKIAYEAPTCHVGDKLNIPSQADIPNAVKYFEDWTRQTVAKQRLEKLQTAPGQQPAVSGDKPHLATQVMDETHLAAKRAAMMVKVAIGTESNKFRTQHEGQGIIDDTVDAFKNSYGDKLGSTAVEQTYQQREKMVALLEKAAKHENLKQFENLYRQCTGKSFNANDFSSGYKKPAQLAFPDLNTAYEQSQAGGRKVVGLTAAGLVASLAVIPGAAPIALSTSARIGLAALAGGSISGSLDVLNKGSTATLGESVAEGAGVGAAVGIAGTLGIASQAGAAAKLGEGALARVLASGAGGMAGGASGAGMIEGGFAIRDDVKKGVFDPVHVVKETAKGILIGGATGGVLGVVGPAVAEGATMMRAAQTAADTAPAIASEAVIASENAAELPKITSQPADVTKTTPHMPEPPEPPAPPTDMSKGSAPPTDVSKSTTQQPDVLKSTTSPSSDNTWQKKLDKLANDPLVKDVQPLELQNGWQGIQYQRKVGGRVIQEMYNPQDSSKIFSEEFKDGFGLPRKEVTTTSADGKEITNKFRLRDTTHGQDWVPVSNKWETYMNDLRRDRSITNLEELPTGSDWDRVRYKTLDGEKIEIAIRETDGTRFFKKEYVDYRGAQQREISTTNADGHKVTHNFTLEKDNTWRPFRKSAEDVKPEPAPQSAQESMFEEKPSEQYVAKIRDQAQKMIDDGNNWIEAKLKSLGADAKEVPLKNNWVGIEYTDSNGLKTVESYRPFDGATNKMRTYEVDGIRYQETTVVPKNGQPVWYKEKQVETKASRFKRQDDPDSAPEYKWDIVDSTQQQNYQREQEARFRTPTE